MKWRTLIWISYFMATCLIRSSSGRGVLTIWLLNYKNIKGRTYDGKCCDEAPLGSKTCPDQCDYVMRCIVTGLGRANDHVFLFHRPIKYDSNDISFEGESSKMSQLTVLFDEWPSSGNVKMDVFFYDYDDFDHTTVLVDWFETPLRRTVEKGERQIEVVRGSRQLDKTILEFKWTVHCFGMNDCLSPPPEWHKWPWHPEDRTPLLFGSSKNIAINTTHSGTTWKPELKTSTVKIFNENKINGWEESKHHWADNSIWLNQSPFLPFRPVRPNPRTTIDDREVLVDIEEHARIIDAEERQDLPEIRLAVQNKNFDSVSTSPLKKGPDHRKHRRKKIEQKSGMSENREQMKTVSPFKKEKIESKNEFPENKNTIKDPVRNPNLNINQISSIKKGSFEKSSQNAKPVVPLSLEPFDRKNGDIRKNQNNNKTTGTLLLEITDEKSIKDIIRETEIKAGAVQNRVRNPFLQEPYKSINEYKLGEFENLVKKTEGLLTRSTGFPDIEVNTTSGTTTTEVHTTHLMENALPNERKSTKSTKATNVSPKEDEHSQGKITITTSSSSETVVSKHLTMTRSKHELVTKRYEDYNITSNGRENKTTIPSGKVTPAVMKNGDTNTTQSFSLRTTDITDSKTKNTDQYSIQSTVPQDIFIPMAMNVPVKLPPKRTRSFSKKSKVMENIKSPFSKPARERNFTPVKKAKIITESISSSRSTMLKQTTPANPILKLNKKIIRPSTWRWDNNYNWKKHYKDFVLPRQFVPRVRYPPAVWTQSPPLRDGQHVQLTRQHVGINQTGAKRYPKESLNKLLQERKNSDIDYGYYRDKHNEFIINHNKKIREEKRKNRLAAKESKRTNKNTKHWRRPKRPPVKSPFTPAQERQRTNKVTAGKTTNGGKRKVTIKSKENVSRVNSRTKPNQQTHSIRPPSLKSNQNDHMKVKYGKNDEKYTKLQEPSSKDESDKNSNTRLKPGDKDSFVRKSPFTPPSIKHKIKQNVSPAEPRVPVNPAYLERKTRLPYRGSLAPGQGFTDWSDDVVTQKAPINPKAVVPLDDDYSQSGDRLAKKASKPRGKNSWLKSSAASRDPHLVDVPVFSNSQQNVELKIFYENEAKVDKSKKQTFDFDVASFLSQPKELVKEINEIAKNTNVMFNISQDSKDNSVLGNKLLISVENLSSIRTNISTKYPLTPSSKKIKSPFSSWTSKVVTTSSSNIKDLGIQSGKSTESSSSYVSHPTKATQSYSHKKNPFKQKNYHSQAFTKSTEVSNKIQTDVKTNNTTIKTRSNKIKPKIPNMNSRKYNLNLKKNKSIVINKIIKPRKRTSYTKKQKPKQKINRFTVRNSSTKKGNGEKTLKPHLRSTPSSLPVDNMVTSSHRSQSTADEKSSIVTLPNSKDDFVSSKKLNIKNGLQTLKPVKQSPFHPKRKGTTNKRRKFLSPGEVSSHSTLPKLISRKSVTTKEVNTENFTFETFSKIEKSSETAMLTTAKSNEVRGKTDINFAPKRKSSTPKPNRLSNLNISGSTSHPVLSIAITPTKPSKQTHHVVNIPSPPRSDNVKSTGGPQIPGVISSDLYQDKADDLFTVNTPLAVLTPASRNQGTTTASYRHRNKLNKVNSALYESTGKGVTQNKTPRKIYKNKLFTTSALKTSPFTSANDPKSNPLIPTSVFQPFTKSSKMTSYSMSTIKTYSPATAGSDQAVSPPTVPRRFTSNHDRLLESFKILDDLIAKAAKNDDTDSKPLLSNGKFEIKTYTSFTNVSHPSLSTTPQVTVRFTIAPLSTKYTTPFRSSRKSTVKWITQSPRVKILNPFLTDVGNKRSGFKNGMGRHTTRGGLQKSEKAPKSSKILEPSYTTESLNSISNTNFDPESVTQGKMNVFEFLPNAMKDIYFGKSPDTLEKNKHTTHKMKTDMSGATADNRSPSYTSSITEASHIVKSTFNKFPLTPSKGIHVSPASSFSGPNGKTALRYQPQSSYSTTVANKMQVAEQTPSVRNRWISHDKGKYGLPITTENNQGNKKHETSRNGLDINPFRNHPTDTNPNQREVPNFVHHESKKDKKLVNFLFRDKKAQTRTTPLMMLSRRQPTTMKSARSRNVGANNSNLRNNMLRSDLASKVTSRWDKARARTTTPQLMLSRRQPTTLKSVQSTIASNNDNPKNSMRQSDLTSRVTSRWEHRRTTNYRIPSKYTLTKRVRNKGGVSSSPNMLEVSILPTQPKFYPKGRTTVYSPPSNSKRDWISSKSESSTVPDNMNHFEKKVVQNSQTYKPKDDKASPKTTEKDTRLFAKTFSKLAKSTNHMTTIKQSPSKERTPILSETKINNLTPKSDSTSHSPTYRNYHMSTKIPKSLESTPTSVSDRVKIFSTNKDSSSEAKAITGLKTVSTIKVAHKIRSSPEANYITLKVNNTSQSNSSPSTKTVTGTNHIKFSTSREHPKNIFRSTSQTSRGGTLTTDGARVVSVVSDIPKTFANAVKNESTIINKKSKMNITSDIFKWIYDISKSIPNSLFSNKLSSSENLTRNGSVLAGSSRDVTEILNPAPGSSSYSPKLISTSERLDPVTSKNNSNEALSDVSTRHSMRSSGTSTVHSTEATIPNRNRGLFFGWGLGSTYSSSTIVSTKGGSNTSTTISTKPNPGIVSNSTYKATGALSVSMSTNMETPTSTLSFTSSPPTSTISKSTLSKTSSRKPTKTSKEKATTASSTFTTPKKLFLTLPPWLKLPDLLKPVISTTSSTTEKPTTTTKRTTRKTTSMTTKQKMASTKRMTTANIFPITRYNNLVTKKRKPVNITINRSPDANNGPRIIIPNGGLYIPSEGDLNRTGGHLDIGVAGSSGARNLRLHGRKMNFKTVFSRYWPAILGLTVGTVFLVAAVLTSVACRQQRLYIRRTGWTDMPHHVSEPPDTSEYSSAASLVSDATRSSISFR